MPTTTKPYAGLDATPFIDIALKSGAPRAPDDKRRVYLPGSRVTPATYAQILAWSSALDISRGAVLDALVKFALARGFVSPTEKKTPALPSTEHAGATNFKAAQCSPSPLSQTKPVKPSRHHA